MQFKSIKIRNECGSNPLQINFSQGSELRYKHFQVISIYNTHSQFPNTKVSFLTFRKTAKTWYNGNVTL
jgi:hypothetical protein